MNLEAKIEAILFWKGEPISRKRLSEILDVEQIEINEAIEGLKENLIGRGIVISETENEITFGTSPQLSDLFEGLQKEELDKDLSKASLETLSIILYKNGASRADIDNIRGVNSSFTLRALSIRGLIDKNTDTKDNRRFVYNPSIDLLSYMGLSSIEELPDFNEINKSIETSTSDLNEQLENEKKE